MDSPLKAFWPPWRFGSNVRSASGPHLDSLSDGAVVAEWCLAGLVVIGVVGEFVIAAMHPPYDSWLDRWGSSYADLLIGIGVAGEVLASMIAHVCQSELTRRSNVQLADAKRQSANALGLAASAQLDAENAQSELAEVTDRLSEAIGRAAKAELETEKLRAVAAWRRLTQAQHEALALALKASGPGASVRFCVLINDHESMNLAQNLSVPFMVAGWNVGYQFNAYTHGVLTGILIPEPRDNWLDEMKVVNGRVRDAFVEANIRFFNGFPMRPYMSTDSVDLPAPIAWVYVGPKPAPPL